MKFYTRQHKYYCGVDLHARSMYVCIIEQDGEVVKHKNIEAEPEAFLRIIKKYREDIVVAVECIFTWYWLADHYAVRRILLSDNNNSRKGKKLDVLQELRVACL